MITSTRIKAAWIRDNVPPGQPAPGHFDCECGHEVRAGHYGAGPDVTCDVCGIRYDNRGHITRPIKTIWDVEKPEPGEQYLICPPPRRRQ